METFYKQRAARLEKHLAEMASTSAALQAQLDEERNASEAQVAELQAQLEHEVQEVVRRQELVCLRL
jgi:Skp family chaperone for outer membrane proteins